LLSGEDATQARILLDELASRLRSPDPELPMLSAQASLFFAYRHLTSGDPLDRGTCEDLLLIAQRAPPDTVGLHGGLAGLGWISAHLQALGLGSSKSLPLLRSIDRALLSFLREPFELFDLIGGLAGIAVYAAERRNSELLGASIRQLAALAREDDRGISWFTTPDLALPDRPPEGYTDLGVAHGIPGVLPALASAIRADAEAPLAARLLDGTLRFLSRTALSSSGPPSLLTLEGQPLPARLAWCYGAPGLAGVLHAIADAHPDAHGASVPLAHSSAACSSQPERAHSSGLCHGSSGLAHLHARLAQGGDPASLEAALRWYRITLLRQNRKVPEPPRGSIAPDRPLDLNFLEGGAGIGLALLAATETLEPAWDRLLGLSLPG
jgi:hypothetical protein